jgi:hypothetical protein
MLEGRCRLKFSGNAGLSSHQSELPNSLELIGCVVSAGLVGWKRIGGQPGASNRFQQ